MAFHTMVMLSVWIPLLMAQGLATKSSEGSEEPNLASAAMVKELLNMFESVHDEIGGLKAENQEQNEEMQHIKVENIHHMGEIKQLKLENDDLRSDNKDLRKRVETLESNLTSLKVQENTFVAFTAYATADRAYVYEERVMFDGIVSNYGEHYNAILGVFICPVNGYYLFNVHYISGASYSMYSSLRINGTIVVTMYAFSSQASVGSNSVVIQCEPEQIVDVICISNGEVMQGGSSTARYSTFSGALLQIIVS